MLSACAKAVCRIHVRISLPTIVQLAPRLRTTGLCCASSIWAELADVARLAALKAFVQWARRMGVVSVSRTCEGTLPADRGASVAAAPAASAATPPPASSVEPPVRGAVVPQSAAGVPSPATVSPFHVCAAEVTGAIGTPPPPLRNRRWRRGGERLALVVLPRPNSGLGGEDPVGEFREPALSPIAFNSLSCAWAVRMPPAFSDAVASPRRRAMKRATWTGCLSLRASTIPTLRSDTTLNSSLRAGCRATFSRSIRRSGVYNTSRATST